MHVRTHVHQNEHEEYSPATPNMQHHCRRAVVTSVKLIFSPENIFRRASSTPLDRAWNITPLGYFHLTHQLKQLLQLQR